MLDAAVRQVVDRSVAQVYDAVHNDLGLDVCSVLVSVNPKRVLADDLFLGFPYDATAVYLFVDRDAARRGVAVDVDAVERNAAEHLYRSLYATSRARHIGLDTDCGLLDEVITEGLSELFVTEKMSSAPKQRFVQFSDIVLKQLWEKMKGEFDHAALNIDRWFLGDAANGIPRFTACSVGFAVAAAYLAATQQQSVDALTASADRIAVLQNRY